jgi:2-amino-4-hydroxy-6-hydroxymethyldihydropteridine diphosphokinase
MDRARVFIALGSNLGDRRGNIEKALEMLGHGGMVDVIKVSSLYETEPVGGPAQDKFLDGVAEIRTALTPHALLKYLKEIEAMVGRTPSAVKWGPREIDLDILLYDDAVINDSELTIPHSLLHLRMFMIEPLAQIAPDVLHPVLGKTAAAVKKELSESNK